MLFYLPNTTRRDLSPHRYIYSRPVVTMCTPSSNLRPSISCAVLCLNCSRSCDMWSQWSLRAWTRPSSPPEEFLFWFRANMSKRAWVSAWNCWNWQKTNVLSQAFLQLFGNSFEGQETTPNLQKKKKKTYITCLWWLFLLNNHHCCKSFPPFQVQND